MTTKERAPYYSRWARDDVRFRMKVPKRLLARYAAVTRWLLGSIMEALQEPDISDAKESLAVNTLEETIIAAEHCLDEMRRDEAFEPLVLCLAESEAKTIASLLDIDGSIVMELLREIQVANIEEASARTALSVQVDR